MIHRKGVALLDENENESLDSPQWLCGKQRKSQRRSPVSQKRGETAMRNSPLKSDPKEPGTESIIREVGPLEGFLNAQRALKSRLGKPFQQLRENEARNRTNSSKEHEKQDEPAKEEIRSSSGKRGSSCRRSSRNGAEKRKNLQDVFTELKTKIRNNKETGSDDEKQPNSKDTNIAESSDAEYSMTPSSDLPHSEPIQTATLFSTGTAGNWLQRPGKLHKLATESSVGLNRWSPFRFASGNRGSDGFHGSNVMKFSSLKHDNEDYVPQSNSLDTKRSQWGKPKPRRQTRKKIVHLRRTKSFNSLQTRRGSGSKPNRLNVLMELSEASILLNQVHELRNALVQSEKALDEFTADSKKNRAEIQEQVDHLADLYSSLIQSQDIRYRSLLDVFHENYKLLGYVESNFDYVLSVVARGRGSHFQTRLFDLLRFVADYTMTPILSVVRLGTGLYLRFFPRKARAA